jgi:hypothetical protein
MLGSDGPATVLLRPSTAPLLLYGLLGAKAVSGSGPYSHVITTANTKPYFTMWRSAYGQLWERFRDCKLSGGNITWEAGGDVSLEITATGLEFERLTSAPVGGTYNATEIPFRVPAYVATIGGSPQTNITGGNINLESTIEQIQTNSVYPSYVEETGRNITFSWNEVWESVANYAKPVYGAAAGTTPTQTPYEAPGGFGFSFPHPTAGYSLLLEAQKAQFFPAQPTVGTDADAVRLPIAGKVARPSSGSIFTATIANGVATYPAAS